MSHKCYGPLHTFDRLSSRRAHPDQLLVLDQAFVALVVLNTREAAMLDDSTPIDTHCWAYNLSTGTQKSQVIKSQTQSPSTCTRDSGRLWYGKVHTCDPVKGTVARNSPHATQSKHSYTEFTTCDPNEAQFQTMLEFTTGESSEAQTETARTLHQTTTHVCLRGSLRCKVSVAQAGGGWTELHYRREHEAAHEDPERIVNRVCMCVYVCMCVCLFVCKHSCVYMYLCLYV